jgi:regulatory protein
MKNKADTQNLEHNQQSNVIRKQCMRLLTRRDHSKKEIQDKLSLKGFERSQVSKVISELSEQNWQNDARYAESYARVRSEKGFGPVRIAFELRQQCIDAETVEQVLQAETHDWFVLLERVYLKKFPENPRFDLNERGKRIRFLLQRGFSNDMINTFLKRQSKIST